MPCEGAHTWTVAVGQEPERGAPCDCGARQWGVPVEQVREHVWEFYMNGTFCRRCGAQLGSGQACRP